MHKILSLLALAILEFAPLARAASNEPTLVAEDKAGDSPYSQMGRLRGFSGTKAVLGTGSAITTHGVLTAGHLLFHRKRGFSTDVRFDLSQYNTSKELTARSLQVYVNAKYTTAVTTNGAGSVQALSKDFGGIVTNKAITANGLLSYRTAPDVLAFGGIGKRSIGYGTTSSDGRVPLESVLQTAFDEISPSFYFSDAYFLEGGMSGGPTVYFDGSKWRLIAVNVSGFHGTEGGGVRPVNGAMENFIDSVLKVLD